MKAENQHKNKNTNNCHPVIGFPRKIGFNV